MHVAQIIYDSCGDDGSTWKKSATKSQSAEFDTVVVLARYANSPPPLAPKKKSLGMSSWCAHALLPVAGDAVIHGRRAADELRF